MELLNSFFSVQSRQEDASGTTSVRIVLNPEHEIFRAHFPGNPIVPGVCQIQMARELIAQQVGASLSLVAVKNIKYLTVMTPTEHLEYDVLLRKLEVMEDKVTATVVYESEGKAYAKLSLAFTKD